MVGYPAPVEATGWRAWAAPRDGLCYSNRSCKKIGFGMHQEITEMRSSRTSRLLVVCAEAEAPGPESLADRCWLLAEALADNHDVILGLPAVTQLSHPDFAVVDYNGRNVGMVARDSDAIISDARALADFPTLLEAG